MKKAEETEWAKSHRAHFSKRHEMSIPSLSKRMMIGAIIVSLISTVLMFFIDPLYILGVVGILTIIVVILKYPIVGLYFYLAVSLLRPQDLIYQLAELRPNISILALTLISIIFHRKHQGRLHLTPTMVDKSFFYFLVAVALSNVTSYWIQNSVEQMLEFYKLVPFYLVAILIIERPDQVHRYLRYALYCMVFVCLVQIWTYHTVGLTIQTGKGGYGIIFPGGFKLGGMVAPKTSGGSVYGVGGYSLAFLANASELGLAAVVYFPIAWYLFKLEDQRFWKAFFLFSSLVLLYSVQVCGSRGAFVGIVVVLMYMFHKARKLIIGTILMLVLGLPLVFLAGHRYVGRIASIADAEEDESANIRFDLWEAGIYMFLSRPVFGIGIMNFENAYGDGRYRVGKAKGYWSPHNVLIQIITETGLVGIAAYLLIIFWIFMLNRYTKACALRVREKQRRLYDALANGLDVALVGFLVAGQFITATYYPHLFQLAFLSSVLYLSAKREARRTEAGIEKVAVDPAALQDGQAIDAGSKA